MPPTPASDPRRPECARPCPPRASSWPRRTSRAAPASRRNDSRLAIPRPGEAFGEKPLSPSGNDAALLRSTGVGGLIPPRFEYFAPSAVDEAVRILARFGGEAKGLAGG